MKTKKLKKSYLERFGTSSTMFLHGRHNVPRKKDCVNFSLATLKNLQRENAIRRVHNLVHVHYKYDLFSAQAFSEVIGRQTDFCLPDAWWMDFDTCFGYYWDVELGHGRKVNLDKMTTSLYKQMHDRCWGTSQKNMRMFCRMIIAYLETIPGVLY